MICPVCHADSAVTEKNYGALYTCPSCQAVYFINFDGQPEYGEMGEYAPQETSMEVADPSPGTDLSEAFSQNSVSGGSDISLATDFSSPTAAFENNIHLTNDHDLAGQMVPGDSIETVNPFSNLNESSFAEPVSTFSEVAQNITDFGNQDVQIAGLSYDLKISGLDTHELRELFKEAINDSRFGWESADLMRTIRNGEVEIIKLNPVQAYILAKRLQFVDIERKWIQNALD